MKIEEAKNVIDNPVNKDKILERLSAMSEDIIFVRKEIENGTTKNDVNMEGKAKRKEEKMKKKKDEGMKKELES